MTFSATGMLLRVDIEGFGRVYECGRCVVGSYSRRGRWNVSYIGVLAECVRQYLLGYKATAIQNGNTPAMIGLPRDVYYRLTCLSVAKNTHRTRLELSTPGKIQLRI